MKYKGELKTKSSSFTSKVDSKCVSSGLFTGCNSHSHIHSLNSALSRGHAEMYLPIKISKRKYGRSSLLQRPCIILWLNWQHKYQLLSPHWFYGRCKEQSKFFGTCHLLFRCKNLHV